MRPVARASALLAAIAVIFLSCFGGGAPTAGGSGAGNPAVIAVVADTSGSQGIGKAALPADSALRSGAAAQPGLRAVDMAGLEVTVNEAWIAISRFSFPMPGGSCAQEEIVPPLVCEAGELVLPGPFVFDLISGQAAPPVALFILPNGTYDRVHADLCSQCDSLLPSMPDSALADYAAVMHGSFVLGDSTVFMDLLLSPHGKKTFLSLSAIELSGGDTARLAVVLDPRQWLSDVDLAGCVAAGALEVDSANVLRIDEATVSTSPCGRTREEITNKILGSGVLRRTDN